MNQTSPPKFRCSLGKPTYFLWSFSNTRSMYGLISRPWSSSWGNSVSLRSISASKPSRKKRPRSGSTSRTSGAPQFLRESNATRHEGSDRRLAKVVAGLGTEKPAGGFLRG